MEKRMKELKHLEKGTYYMNPCTGNVASGEEWEQDYEEQRENDPETREMSWEQWGGNTLIEVKYMYGDWVEVE